MCKLVKEVFEPPDMPATKAVRLALAAAALALGSSLALPAPAQSLVLDRTIELPDVRGRLDHLDIDIEGSRLLVAALGALREAQGDADVSRRHRRMVAVASVVHLDDADNLRFDAAANQLFLGYGQALAVLDPQTLQVVRRWALAGHPEAFAIENSGRYVYVNVPSASHIAVVDRRGDGIVATWPVAGASGNFAMALDVASRRLFVATRRPALLLAYDTESGKRVGELAICGDADDLFFDGARRQLYAAFGQGQVDAIRQRGADRYEVTEQVSTAPGARTGLFVSDRSTLFVAVPAHAGASAEIRVYRVQ